MYHSRFSILSQTIYPVLQQYGRKENDCFRPYMAILGKKLALDGHLQNVQVRSRPKGFIIHPDRTRKERCQSFRNSNTATNDNLSICTIKNNKFQSNRCNHRKEANSSLIPTILRQFIFIIRHYPLVPRYCRNIQIQQTIYSHLIFSRSPRCCCCCCCREVRSAVHARSRLPSLFGIVGAYLAFFATPVAPPHWGTTLSGFALLPSPPAVAAEPSTTSLVHLPPRPCLPRRPPFPLPLPFQPSLAGLANLWLGQPQQEQQLLCVPLCQSLATHNRDLRGAPLATDCL